MRHRPILVMTLVMSLAALFARPAITAETPGRIAGTVRVAGGEPAGRVAVTIHGQDTGTSRVAVTAGDGGYQADGLPPGLYTVSADVQGFRKAVVRDQRLAAGERLVVDLSLELRMAGEVTVTARKREDTVGNTPFSVAAPSADELRDRGAENLEGVAANVANFSVQNLGPGQSQVAMRGVSSGQIARDQPGVKEQVGAYLDESSVSLSLYTPDLDLFDMARVEVLRGPQGTLFGAGSLAGTVRYISNPPELGATRFFGELGGDTLSGGGQGGDLKAGINLPLADRSALRVAGYLSAIAGYTDAVRPDLSIEHDVDHGRRAGVRTVLEFDPDDRVKVTPRFVYQDVKMDGWNRADAYNILANPFTTTRPAVSFGERQEYIQLDESFTDKFYLGDLNVKVDLGGMELTSITSYSHRDILDRRDTTQLTASFTGGNIGLPEPLYTLDSPMDDVTTAWGWTQELRLAGSGARGEWLGGGYFSTTRRDFSQDVQVPGFEDATGIPTTGLLAPKDSVFYSELSYELRQFALFGEGTLKVSDRLRLTGGLRYYRFSEDKDQTFDGVFGNDQNGVALLTNSGTTEADGVAPRFIASFELSDTTRLDAQVSKGFRLGGINDPLNVPLCTPGDLATFGGNESWKDERAWNYELGTKSSLWGGRGSLNVSGFYIDIRDLQTTVTAGTCSSRLVYNVPRARSLGGELEFQASAGSRLDFNASVGYADATLRSTLRSTAADGSVSVVSGIEEGRRLPSVPRLQGAAAVTYHQPLDGGFLGYATAAWSHVGSRYTQVGDEDPGFGSVNLLSLPHTIGGPLTQGTFSFDPLLPAYDIVNLRLGVRRDRWDAAFYINNLTDERALLALDRERGLLARAGWLTNPPRTFGISSRVTF